MATDPHSTQTAPAQKRSAVANTFIAVGLLLLIFIGIAVAIYSSRYVPMAVNTFSSSNPVTGLPGTPVTQTGSSYTQPAQVASTQGTALPFGGEQTSATSTPMTSSGVTEPQTTTTQGSSAAYTTTPFPTTGPAYSTLPGGYQATASAYPAVAPQSSYTAEPYGLADLSTSIVAVGYLANSSNSSFVATPVIPVDARAAVQFTIGNTGSAPTGPWTFMANIPTDNGYIFQSPIEESLNPGDHILFTLAFDQVPPGPAELITIIADPNNFIQEVTKSNNTAGASVSVVGS